MKLSRSTYFRLLIIAILGLVLVFFILMFSNNFGIPTIADVWASISRKAEVQPREDYVRFIDVGQGDCILISSNGYNAVVDFGNKSDYGTELLDSLKKLGITRIDCAILSHYDSDHVGGGSKIIRAIDTRYALLPELDDRSDNDFTNFQHALENSKTQIVPARVGTVINIGEFEITVLAYNNNATNSNDKSVVLMAEISGKKFLLTGDAGTDVEKQLIQDKINIDCDVYKAAHHGSRNSNSAEFITAASPEYAVISVGASNSYGHPHTEVIDNLNAVGAKIYRTDRSGDITFFVEDGNITAKTEF
ncbi:MAG: MBL fold metallo-hydrolase [Clostridia bacterium]|nr:MBL fold metallo-hydrolase [Clostridia bacterium]